MMRKKKQEFMTNSMTYYPEDILVLQETFLWAQEQHSKQQQIITLIPNAVEFPYFSHPLSVALFAMSLHLPSVMIQACLLHDVIEDCGCKEQKFVAKW
jgi:(p)ppGpp synthase/HD superfamily hydrolase